MIDLGKNLEETRKLLGEDHVITKYIEGLNAECTSDEYDGECYDYCFGGHFYICDKPLDLEQVQTLLEDEDGRYKTLFETAASFDVAEKVGDYIAVALLTNNSGGNTYFITKEVQEAIPHVVDCIELTRKYWELPPCN